MKRGLLFALLSASLVTVFAVALVAAAFVRPRVFRGLLFAQSPLGRGLAHRSAYPSANAEVVAQANPAVVTVIATRAERHNAALQGLQERLHESDDPTIEPLTPQAHVPEARPQRGSGTGFIIDPDGLIVTNEHVIKEADRIKVKLADGRERRAVVQGADHATDIALLKIEASDLPVLPLGDSDAVRVGDPVIAIGNPLDYEHSVTSGIVSAKGRKVYNDPPFENFIQTDAAINRGNSGGPLLNLAGEVVGVNTIIRVDGRGISFAVPSNVVKQVIAQLRAQGYVVRGKLGVAPQNLTPEFCDGLGLGGLRGVLVAAVNPDTAAARAGIQPYDVITHFDGQTVSNSDEFFNLVAGTPPQREVEIELVRGGQTLRLRARLDQREEEGRARQSEPPASLERSSLHLGFSVRDNTPEAQHALRVGTWTGQVTGGVIISEIDPLSAAADAGLAVGHVILEANRQEIHDLQDFQRIVERLHDGSALVLRISSPHQKDYALVAIRVGEEK